MPNRLMGEVSSVLSGAQQAKEAQAVHVGL